MAVDPATAKHHHQHAGTDYYFCCRGCLDKFAADPERYLKPASETKAEAVPAGTVYTCPMHPEVTQIGPGTCPICGMALEPQDVTADEGPNPELIDMRRRLWIGAAFTVPLLVLAMSAHIPGVHLSNLVPPRIDHWIQLALATPVVVWCGS